MSALIESVPNLSEGRRPDIVQTAVKALKSHRGVFLLDVHSDRDHNRSVLTLLGTKSSLQPAILDLFEVAVGAIDLRQHRGAHPRVGAVDVVPFVPMEGVCMQDCVTLAREVGAQIASRYRLPVYLYEEAATAPHRKRLEALRGGEFEGLSDKMKDPRWLPDFGPHAPHPSAGATLVGARSPLIAYNINLDTPHSPIAEKIARAIRQSSGGHVGVKAIGVFLKERNLAQVSVNLTDYKQTPLHVVFEAVQEEARRHGVGVLNSEIVGLVPAEALRGTSERLLKLEGFSSSKILEERIARIHDAEPG